MSENKLFTYEQLTAYDSPRSLSSRLVQFSWNIVWALFCSWTPKPLNPWRIFWLRLFGSKIQGKPFVHGRAQIHLPWNLSLHDRACLASGAVAYSLGEVELLERSTVAQEVYLCAATHKFDDLNLPLQVGKITIGKDAFVGARAFILPGITVGEGSVIGAASVVSEDVPPWVVAAGNPCKVLKPRIITEGKQL